MPEDTTITQPVPVTPQPTPAVEVTAPVDKAASPKKNNLKLPLLALAVLAIVAIIGVGAYFVLSKTTKPAVKETAAISAVTETKEDPNTITVWSWNTAAKALQELVPAFNKVYPNIKVKIVEIPYNEANARFKTAVSTGVGFPDVWDT